MTRKLIDELDDLHAGYVSAVNIAVEDGDLVRAAEHAAMYEDDAIQLMAEREGKTHLLPLRRQKAPDSTLRRLVNRLRPARAA